MSDQEKTATMVFGGLLALTAVTIGFYFLPLTRIPALTLALTLASLKAGLIGWFFMDLRKADALTLGVVISGVVAVVILTVGILPDVGRVLPG